MFKTLFAYYFYKGQTMVFSSGCKSYWSVVRVTGRFSATVPKE